MNFQISKNISPRVLRFSVYFPELIIISFVLMNAFSAFFRLIHNLGVARTNPVEIISHIDNVEFTHKKPTGEFSEICNLPINVHPDKETLKLPIRNRDQLLTTSYSQAMEPTYKVLS